MPFYWFYLEKKLYFTDAKDSLLKPLWSIFLEVK